MQPSIEEIQPPVRHDYLGRSVRSQYLAEMDLEPEARPE